jgi:zinc protease
MRRRHRLIVLLLGSLLSIYSHAREPVSACGGVVAWPHSNSDLTPDPAVVFGHLPNGLRYALLPNRQPPDRVQVHLVVNAGSLQERDDQRGIAHFLEHMLFNGSTHFPPGKLVEYFQKIGMQFGPDANARTGFFDTIYDINLPRGDRATLEEAFNVLRDYAAGALLLPQEVQRERHVILAEMRDRDTAAYRTYVATLAFEMAGTRFPARLPIGDLHGIRRASVQALRAYYDRWYRPENMLLVMVGDFEPAQAAELALRHLGTLQARGAAGVKDDWGAVVHHGHQPFYHLDEEVGNTTVTLQVLSHIDPQPDSAARQRRALEEYLANQIVQSRLNRILNQNAPPFTEASIGSGIYLHQARYGFISGDCRPEMWRETLNTLDQVLRQALAFGFQPAEVKRAQDELRADLRQQVAQAATRASGDLARQLIYALTSGQVFRAPAQELAFASPILDGIDATQLHAALRRIWRPDHRLIMVTGNARLAGGRTAAAEQLIRDAYNASQTISPAPPAAAPVVVFPYLAQPPAPVGGLIAERRQDAALGITVVRFRNGLQLNLKPTAFTTHEILFALRLGQGRALVPEEKAGLAALSEAVLNDSGIGPLDPAALEAALAGHTTEISFSVREDAFVFQGRTTPTELELMFQLLQAHLDDPAFRTTAFDLARRRYAQTFAQMRRSVEDALDLYGYRFLSGGDARFGDPSWEEFSRLTLADVEMWLTPVLRGGLVELSLVGDYDPEDAVQLAARYLGARATASGPARRMRSPVFPEGGRAEVEVPTQIEKGLMVMAFPTADRWDIDRTRRLNVLAEIFSDRLRVRVREKLGAAYSPFAFSWPSRTYPGFGLFVIHLPVSPKQFDAVRREVTAIARDLANGDIHPDELQRAVAPILTGIKDGQRDNRYWLETVLAGASLHPEQLSWAANIEEGYRSIAVDDLRRLARDYLTPARAAVFTARPGKTN